MNSSERVCSECNQELKRSRFDQCQRCKKCVKRMRNERKRENQQRKEEEKRKMGKCFESLQMLAFTKLTQSQVSKLDDTHIELVKSQFRKWFDIRLKQAKVDFDSNTTLSLRNATWYALSDTVAPTSDKDDFHLEFDCTRSIKLRVVSKWLGVKWVWEDEKQRYGLMRRKISDDKRAFEIYTSNKTYTQVEENIKKNMFMTTHSNKRQKEYESGPSVSCDSCGVSSRTRDICMSVYHSGYYCDDCLEAGACETDPGGDSKWESWSPRW